MKEMKKPKKCLATKAESFIANGKMVLLLMNLSALLSKKARFLDRIIPLIPRLLKNNIFRYGIPPEMHKRKIKVFHGNLLKIFKKSSLLQAFFRYKHCKFSVNLRT